MGSGIAKCFVSNQSIPEDIPVMIFPIIQSQGFYQVNLKNEYEEVTVSQPNSTIVYHNCLYEFQGVSFTAKNGDGLVPVFNDSIANKQNFLILCQYLYEHS